MEKNKIKIIYILNSFALGGAEKLVLDLCRNIDKEQFEIAVCSVVGGGHLEKEFRKLDLPVTRFEKKTKLGLGVLRQLIKYLKKEKPDIVHTHLFGGDAWGRFAAIINRVPVIISTEHSINLDEGWLKRQIKFIFSWFTDKIIAVSKTVKDNSIKLNKIKPDKISVIYNGIDIKKFSFRGFQPIDLVKTINGVIVARLEEVKGHKYLINALPLIIKKYPDFVLNIVGTGSLEKELKEQVNNLNLQDKVIFWGQRLDPENILPKMDLFILSSLWEGLGVVLLEAQAVGLPVITSDIPGIKEVVEDNKTGLVFKPQNPHDLFKNLDKLLSDAELQKKIVENAHKQIKEKFTVEKMINGYSDLYLELIKN